MTMLEGSCGRGFIHPGRAGDAGAHTPTVSYLASMAALLRAHARWLDIRSNTCLAALVEQLARPWRMTTCIRIPTILYTASSDIRYHILLRAASPPLRRSLARLQRRLGQRSPTYTTLPTPS